MFCTLFALIGCNDSRSMVLIQQKSSPDEENIAYVYNFSLGATNPSGEKVYLSNSDGTEKTEVFSALGYICDLAWADDTSLIIFATKDTTMDFFRIDTQITEWKDIQITYY